MNFIGGISGSKRGPKRHKKFSLFFPALTSEPPPPPQQPPETPEKQTVGTVTVYLTGCSPCKHFWEGRKVPTKSLFEQEAPKTGIQKCSTKRGVREPLPVEFAVKNREFVKAEVFEKRVLEQTAPLKRRNGGGIFLGQNPKICYKMRGRMA